MGFGNPEILQGGSIIIFGFIGWGVGAFFGHFRNGDSQFLKKKKFKVFQGGNN
jgi:hypothetical protein